MGTSFNEGSYFQKVATAIFCITNHKYFCCLQNKFHSVNVCARCQGCYSRRWSVQISPKSCLCTPAKLTRCRISRGPTVSGSYFQERWVLSPVTATTQAIWVLSLSLQCPLRSKAAAAVRDSPDQAALIRGLFSDPAPNWSLIKAVSKYSHVHSCAIILMSQWAMKTNVLKPKQSGL